jgi:hypothetical protein
MKTACENEPERRGEKLKKEISELLFALQNPSLDENQRRKLWRSFERKLRRYVDLRFSR